MLDDFKIDYTKFENIAKNWGSLQSYINLNSQTNYLKTHSAMCTIGPYKFTNAEHTKGGIYLIRDPRDVLVSYSHHLGLDYEKTYELISGKYHFEYPNSKIKFISLLRDSTSCFTRSILLSKPLRSGATNSCTCCFISK